VGITNQRATTIVFDPLTGAPVGPALGWQDLRTVIDCLVLQGEGLRWRRTSRRPRRGGS
jgi:glycerol kinase